MFLSRLPCVCCFSKMNSRQENRSKLSFIARIITKYSLERFLSICGEKMSKGFLKFCNLISNLILGQIIVSILQTCITKQSNKLRSTSLNQIYKKKTSNTIITQAYHSRCSPERYQVRPVSLLYSDLRIKQSEKRKRCHPKSDFRLCQSDVFLNQKPNKQTSHE